MLTTKELELIIYKQILTLFTHGDRKNDNKENIPLTLMSLFFLSSNFP